MSDHAIQYSQDTRLLAIDTPLGPNEALLVTLEGEDVLSRCFLYRVTIETQQSDTAVQSLLGMPVTLWLLNDDPERRRPIHGHVRRLVGRGFTPRGSRLFELEVVPRLWFLSCTSDCRIFQNQSIPDIIQTIFNEQGLIDFEFRVMRTDYPPVEYCVQYQETALDFVSRLMEHLGLFFWHEHSADKHLLVVADRNTAAQMCQPAEVRVSPPSGTGELQTLDSECTFRPGRWALNDYDFQSPTKLLRVDAPTTLTVPRMANHEMYEYPGKFLDQDTGKRLSRLRIELEEAQQHRVFGTGRCAGFDPGRRFTVAATRGSRGTTYLLTEVRHHATAPGAETDGHEASYCNDYVAIPVDLPFRPERRTPKPVIHSVQTATVVGPPGENIFCDPFGRVRVQFHWDRRGQRNHQSSCWMRVSQTRAGSYYGSMVIPHVGHEVIVSFLEGDPDRPMITGTVPNALTLPPMTLPLNKDQTIQRDHGNNKIVMNGKAGNERLSMISPRAVNMFASGRSASPLSASVTVPPPSQTITNSATFYSDPLSYNLGTTLNSGTTAAGQTQASDAPAGATSVVIPVFQDAVGLTELWNEWYGTVQSDVASSTGINTTQTLASGATTGANYGGSATTDGTAGSYGTQDGTTADSYLNWGSEGKINCLVLDNNNLWVWGNGNTWINGQVNTQINSNSTTQIGTASAPVVAKTTIYGANNSIILGANVTSVVGDNTTSVAEYNESFVGGLNLAVNIGLNTTINVGGSYTVNLADVDDFSPFQTDTKAEQIKLLGQQMKDVGQSIKILGVAIESTGAAVHDCESKIEECAVKIATVDTHLYQTQVILIDADMAVWA